jgi:hypothetical protein
MERGVTCVGWGGGSAVERANDISLQSCFGMRSLKSPPEGKNPLVRPRHRREECIKMDLQEVGWGGRTGLVWLRIGTGGGRAVVHEAMDLRVA